MQGLPRMPPFTCVASSWLEGMVGDVGAFWVRWREHLAAVVHFTQPRGDGEVLSLTKSSWPQWARGRVCRGSQQGTGLQGSALTHVGPTGVLGLQSVSSLELSQPRRVKVPCPNRTFWKHAGVLMVCEVMAMQCRAW